jgi:hypothetical protein
MTQERSMGVHRAFFTIVVLVWWPLTAYAQSPHISNASCYSILDRFKLVLPGSRLDLPMVQPASATAPVLDRRQRSNVARHYTAGHAHTQCRSSVFPGPLTRLDTLY